MTSKNTPKERHIKSVSALSATPLLLLPTLLILVFQNCAPAAHSFRQTNATSSFGEEFKSLKPTLAIRGSSCTMCHAQVQSGVITDFGFGNDFFLAKDTTNNSPYRMKLVDDRNQWLTASINGSIAVPKTGAVDASKSVKDLLTGLLGNSQVDVVEKDEIYIGAPGASQIIQKSGLTSSKPMAYKADKIPQLTGIVKAPGGKYFTNDGTINCDGDLAIDGVLFLKGAEFSTKRGCRIYATKSIFVEGGINIVGGADCNVQLLSARLVSFGLGKCETTDYLAERVGWAGVGYKTRSASGMEMANAVKADADLIGTLADASCSSLGPNINYERLLVNAPQVHSRYSGLFKGTIIAEVGILKLDAMKFSFDDVFERVPVLPLTGANESLRIK